MASMIPTGLAFHDREDDGVGQVLVDGRGGDPRVGQEPGA